MRGRGRGTDPQWITQEFARAEDLAAAGQMERARDRYAKLARRLLTAPEDVRHYRGLALLGEAETILAMGVFTDAMARFREAYPLLSEPFRQLPRWLVRQFAEERMRIEDGDLRPVTDFLQALAYGTEAGDEETAVRAIMWLQERCMTGPNAQREATARAALVALPGVDWPVLALTTMLRRDGRVKEAEDLLAEWVPGGSGELWFRWGIQLSTLRRYDQAISAYDEAERRGTGPASPWSRGPWLRPEAMLFRGLAHQQMGRTGHAEQDLRAAAAVAPQDPRVHYSLGRLSVQLGADYQAWSHFSTALAVESAFAPARLGLALLREQSGRPAEAIAHYQAALRHDNSSRAARIRLGAVLLAAGRRDEAEELLHPEAEESSYWGGMASFHYGLAQLRANDPAGALATWEKLRTGELREWIAVARDREARKRLNSDPTAARLQLQLALLDAPEVTERRVALREAALREAAWLLLAGREQPEVREKAAVALDLAASLPLEERIDPHRTRQKRLRGLVDLAGGETANLPDFLSADGPVRDRCHLAVAALVDGRVEQALALLVNLPAEPDCDPEVARVRALVAERTGEWAEAVRWHQRFLDNDVVPVGGVESAASEDADSPGGGVEGEDDAESTLTLDVNEIALAGERAAAKKAAEAAAAEEPGPLCGTAVGVECAREASHTCAGCGREGCDAHLYRPSEQRSYRCERCAESALHAILYAARRAGVPGEAERTLTIWAPALQETGLTPQLRRQIAMLRAESGDLDGALERLPDDAQAERVDLLIRRAAEAIRRGEPYLALGDLRAALGVQPDQPQAKAALEALAEYEARQHAEELRERQAFDAYLALVRDDPTNPRLLHALGLAAYRLARTGGAAEHWMWTIGCLVSALHAPDFRPRATGASPEALASGQERFVADRGFLMEELRDTLRAVDEANGRTGDEVDSWAVRFGMDVFACQSNPVLSPTLDALLREQPETPALREWRDLTDTLRSTELAEMAEAEASGDGAERSRTVALYGALGLQHFLYEDGRYEAAIAGLDTVPEDERGREWTALLRKTLVMRGMELHLDEQWADALECIARAAELTPDVAPEAMLVEIAAESGTNAARALLGRPVRGIRDGDVDGGGREAGGGEDSGGGEDIDSEARTVELGTPEAAGTSAETIELSVLAKAAGVRAQAEAELKTVELQAGGGARASAQTTEIKLPAGDDWQSVIAVLERALTVAPEDPGLRGDLAVAYTRKAAELRTTEKDYVLALAHVRRALDLTPDDPEAFALLEVVLGERAGALTRPGPDGDLLEAVQWWQELSEIDPKPEYQAGLSRALVLLACSAALASRRSLALDRMAWALLADPEWSGDADAAAVHQVANHLIAQAMDEHHPKPFNDRAHRLRTALTYRDTPELRALMIALWKNEATFQYETRHYGLCAALLEEAVRLGEDPNATLNLTRPPAGQDPDALQAFHWHRYPKARSLIKRTVDHFPDDDELRELHARSTANDDPASP